MAASRSGECGVTQLRVRGVIQFWVGAIYRGGAVCLQGWGILGARGLFVRVGEKFIDLLGGVVWGCSPVAILAAPVGRVHLWQPCRNTCTLSRGVAK